MKKYLISFFVLFTLCFCFTQPIFAEEFPLPIESEYAIVLNLDDNRTVFEKNCDEKMYPASMTKVMTVWVALQHIDNLDSKITMTSQMFEGLWESNASVAGFVVGEQVTIRDLLYGILLPSGADASRAIAYSVAGSEEAFVELMNQEAQAMGLTHTHFVNTSGLHDDNHYTTAREMAEIVKRAIQNPTFLEMYETQRYTTAPTKQHPKGLTFLANAHRYAMDAHVDDSLIQGSKTGYTDEGGMCLSSITTVNEMHFLMIVGQAGTDRSVPQHLLDTINTYEYLTQHYEKVTLKKEYLSEIEVKYYGKLPIQLEAGYQVVVPKNKTPQLHFQGKETYEAPLAKDTNLGEVEISVDDEIIKTIPIHADRNIERKWYLTIAEKLWEKRLVLLLGVLVIFVLINYSKNKTVRK